MKSLPWPMNVMKIGLQVSVRHCKTGPIAYYMLTQIDEFNQTEHLD